MKTKTDSVRASSTVERVCSILVVDDHDVIRLGLKTLLNREPDMQVCGEAASAADVMRLLPGLAPDVVVLDLALGDDSGLDLIKTIKSRYTAAKIIVFSMLNESVYGERVLCAGALGYVSKHDAPELLLEAIRVVQKGDVYLGECVKQQIARRLVYGGKKDSSVDVLSTLSDRELQILVALGNGDKPAHIASTMHLSVKTVGSYVERIKGKLGITSAPELCRFAIHWVHSEP